MRSYTNQRILGKGKNGTTYLVTCSTGEFAGLQFALKVLHRLDDVGRRAEFLREAEHLRGLSHPAVVRVVDSGSYRTGTSEYPFFVMEYVASTLRDGMSRLLPRVVAIRYAMHILSALAHIHAKDIVHRDVKPENILMSGDMAKLTDFGLAKVLSSGDDGVEDDEGDDDDCVVGGTALRMPSNYRTPELVDQARGGQIPLTTASDVFQAGTVLYELLTGKNPQVPVTNKTDDIVLKPRALRGEQGLELKALLDSMLDFCPQKRPTAGACLERLLVTHIAICNALNQAEGRYV